MPKILKKVGSFALMAVTMPVLTVVSMANAVGKEAVKCGEITVNWIKEIVNS